ncbi:MAG TPA: hypothetical protein VFA98_16575 [Thermoanaerobaculia bacterium]|nr:hypothetical protein [Thermoanaerobaculia bacterium]
MPPTVTKKKRHGKVFKKDGMVVRTVDRPRPEVLRDAAGDPVIAYVRRNTAVADPWVKGVIRWFCPVVYRLDTEMRPRGHFASSTFTFVAQPVPRQTPHGAIRLHKKARIVFRGSSQWHEARKVFVQPKEGAPDVPIIRALRTLSHDAWWIAPSGALEQRATIYEARTEGVKPPRPGWRLSSSAEVAEMVGASKRKPEYIPRGDVEAEAGRREALRRHGRTLLAARKTLEAHERGLLRKQEIVERWRERVRKLSGEGS